MELKASIIIAAYEKNKELPNVFYSISRQKADFEWQVCFLDDCSYEDPKPIYDKYLKVKNKKGMRLKQHIGTRGAGYMFRIHNKFMNAFQMALAMADEPETAILQSADVLWTTDDMLQKMVDGIRENELLVPAVLNMVIDPDLHKHFNRNIKELPACNSYYQGSRRPIGEGVAAFLLPVDYRWLIDEVKYLHSSSEFQIASVATRQGRKYVYRDDIVGIHQHHHNVPFANVTCDADLVNWSDDINIHPERVLYESGD